MTFKTRVMVIVALLTLALVLGAATAHAQGFCYREPMHPGGHVIRVWNPYYGWVNEWQPCTHWRIICTDDRGRRYDR